MFRDYGGIELLRDSFEVHKDLSIAKAFSHAIDIDNSILITHIYLFHAHYFFKGSSNIDYINDIGRIIGEVFLESKLDEKTIEGFLDFLADFKEKILHSSFDVLFFKGVLNVINNFINNKLICIKALKSFLIYIPDSSKNIHNFYFYLIILKQLKGLITIK